MAHGRGKARRLTYDGGRAGMVRLSLYPSMSRLFGVNNVHRSPFTVHRSPFTVHRSAFGVPAAEGNRFPLRTYGQRRVATLPRSSSYPDRGLAQVLPRIPDRSVMCPLKGVSELLPPAVSVAGLVSCPRNTRYFVAIKMGRRQGGPSRTGAKGAYLN
jgi:hypothetical protein